ncbi:arylsulfatase B-like isoform X3 [Dermacentor albipictus]|uniref:arylsulfatase B-like isoform X3 n=1 Tax=Dermacentor albipictus TaxID=60249 RepID=UPI0038FC80C1
MPRWFRTCTLLTVGGAIGALMAYGVYVLVTPRQEQVKKPHIIFILADDLGWADVSFHGCPQIPTPNLDTLAADGVVLNNYYVHPTCTASRGALMTGLYSTRYGLQHIPIQPGEPYGLDLKYTLLPAHLKRLGYETHLIGKWHLGSYRYEYTPTRRGFDSFYGFYYGHEDYHTHMLHHSQDGKEISGLDLWNGTEPAEDAMGVYGTELFAEEAVRLIQNLDKSKPQFLYLSQQAVHSGNADDPLQSQKKNVDKFPYIGEKNRTIYAGGSVSDLGPLDGKDVWAAVSRDEPSPRSDIVYNIDPLWDYAAIRRDSFKIVVGSHAGGRFDQHFPIPGGRGTPQKLDALMERSLAAETLRALYNKRELGFAPDWRTNTTLSCPDGPCGDESRFQSSDNVFLFDLDKDPCECNNLASTHKQVLDSMNRALEEYRAQTVPPLKPAVDPTSFPENHNGTWAPWVD